MRNYIISQNLGKFALLIISPILVNADNGATPQNQNNNNGAYSIGVLCLFFVLVATTAACLVRRYGCLGLTTTNNTATNNNGDQDDQRIRVTRGMDAQVIESLPSLRFSDIKMHLVEKTTNNNDDHQQLECSVCLNEFKGQEDLRLLPDCLHVFHPHCIKPWLSKHAACPVCRASLEHVQGFSASLPSILERFSGTLSQRFDQNHHHVVDVDHLQEMIVNEPSDNNNVQDCDEVNLDRTRRRLRKSFSTGELVVRLVGRNNSSQDFNVNILSS